MDLLFKRYASPFSIIDEMLFMGKMQEFINHLFEEEQEDLRWEVWLHKIQGMSYDEYKAKCEEHTKSYAMTTKQVDKTVEKSKSILKGFKPK